MELVIDHNSDIHKSIDELEAAMVENFNPIDCPVLHSFSPGFYIRQIFMPAGSLITSLIHKTRHSFQITKGIAKVKINENEWEELKAGHVGITEPGTRRVLFIEEDCIWTTFHPIAEEEHPLDYSDEEIEKSVEKIANRIIEWRENTLLGGSLVNGILINPVKIIENV